MYVRQHAIHLTVTAQSYFLNTFNKKKIKDHGGYIPHDLALRTPLNTIHTDV
jgi:hypothetical protein